MSEMGAELAAGALIFGHTSFEVKSWKRSAGFSNAEEDLMVDDESSGLSEAREMLLKEKRFYFEDVVRFAVSYHEESLRSDPAHSARLAKRKSPLDEALRSYSQVQQKLMRLAKTGKLWPAIKEELEIDRNLQQVLGKLED